MSQESTIICVDNSEWMRNGDLQPTRFNSQQEAVRVLVHYKLRSNPENAVGLISLANRIQVLNSLLTEDRKLMVRLHSLEINGVAKVLDGMKTAYLALRHRKNKNHKQRIVVFVGSPLDKLVEEREAFLKFSKKLKKEKVSVDFVLFGEATSENNRLVGEFVDQLNGSDGTGSHLLVVPAGDVKLYEALLHSPICEGAGGAPGAGGEFGINDEDDPELAMALRISLEEQRLRQQQQEGGGAAGGAAAAAAAMPAAGGGQQPADGGGGGQAADVPMEVGEPAADNGSVGGGGGPVATAVRPPTPAASARQQPPPNFEQMSEEEQMAYALRLSMEQGDQQGSRSRSPSMAMSTPAPTPMETEEGGEQGGSGSEGGPVGELLNDPERLKELVAQQGPQGGGSSTTASSPKSPPQQSGSAQQQQAKGTGDNQKKKDAKNEEDKKPNK